VRLLSTSLARRLLKRRLILPSGRAAFTRLITSLYVLILLSLQTHVQLALLGRASYVDSLVSSLPPRTPSPRTAAPLPLPDSTAALSDKPFACDSDDHDLERALYEAKRLPPTADERREEKERERKDLERKYLTFSWWLLHEGWKVVRERVEQAVEAVVGPCVARPLLRLDPALKQSGADFTNPPAG